MSPPPWNEFPVIRHGYGGERTDVICGTWTSRTAVRPGTGRIAGDFRRPDHWHRAAVVESSLRCVLEATEGGTADSQLLARLPAIVLAEVLRLHIATAPAADRGWLGALRDPVLAPALAALHRTPERKWTVADLAAASSVSRTVLDARFRHVLGRPPIRDLTDWRLHVAKELLATADLGMHAIARRVGYDSDEAFSRAFKRAYGLAPAHWRTMDPRQGPSRTPGHDGPDVGVGPEH